MIQMPVGYGDDEHTFDGLIDEIVGLTRIKKLQWRETADENTFICVLKGGSIEIAQREDFNEDTGQVTSWLEATLLNPEGRAIESRSSRDEVVEDGQIAQLRELLDLARSQARNSSGVLERLFEEVGALRGA
jgi:hypothetical protein